jgi:signal transduction histidine kinase
LTGLGGKRLREVERELEVAHREIAAGAARMAAVDEAHREFVARSSHELRTPLTSILGYLEEVIDMPSVVGDAADFVRVAYRNAQRLHALVDDLLVLDQLDTHNVEMHATPIHVSRLLEPLVRELEVSCLRKGVGFLAPAAASRVDVFVDVPRTQQILSNLAGNALKHTPAGGVLAIEIEPLGAMCEISVVDTGMGIPADEIDKVFDRFFRSRASTREAIPGTGLGLSIARSLAEAQGGSLSAASVEGAGSTFALSVPVVAVGTEVREWLGSL